MTEAGWKSCADPGPMLEFLGGKASERKLKLFSCACLRRVWHLVADGRIRRLVEVAELEADGRAAARVIGAAVGRAKGRGLRDPAGDHLLHPSRELSDWLERRGQKAGGHLKAATIARGAVGAFAYTAFYASGYDRGTTPAYQTPVWLAAESSERAAQCELVREVFGNPFRPTTIDPAWQGPEVMALAQAAYEERTLPAGTLDPARLAVLADALEDLGCTDADILAHLRGPRPHYRGCWALDVLLGKA